MKYFFLFLFLFFGNYSVCAQHMISKQLPFFYQLSSNEIFDIYQDREGYLWIGTTNGLWQGMMVSAYNLFGLIIKI